MSDHWYVVYGPLEGHQNYARSPKVIGHGSWTSYVGQAHKFTAAEVVAILLEVEEAYPIFRGRFVAVEVEP